MKKRRFYIGLTGVILTALAVNTPAQAGFEWRGPVPAEMVVETTVTELPAPIGAEPTALAVPVAPVTTIEEITTTTVTESPISTAGSYHGFGRDIPLGMAVKQIVPSSMNVVYENTIGVNLDQPVSWTGDGSWHSTLDKILNRHGMSFDVRGDAVYITKQMASVTPVAVMQPAADSWAPEPVPVKTLSSSAPLHVEVEQTRYQPVAIHTAPPVVMHSGWSANAQETLRQILERWSAQNGTSLQWAIDYDYRLKKPVSFDGSFENAVESLLDEFRTVEPRPYGELKARMGGGRSLVIRAYGIN